MTEPKSRRTAGVTEFECHRVNGESAWIGAVDARHAIRNHPDEWAFEPFSTAQQRAAQADMPRNPDNVAL